MMDIKTKEQIREEYKKKAKLFAIIAAGVFVLLALISILYFTGAVQPEESTDGTATTSVGTGIAMIVVGVVAAAVLLIIAYVNFSKTKGQKLDAVYNEYLTEVENDKKREEENKKKEEAKEQEKAEQLAKVSADFDFNKTIKINEYETVWINSESKLIQFLLRASTDNEKEGSTAIKKRSFFTNGVYVYKTKVFDVNAIKSCKLVTSTSISKHYSGSGARSSSAVNGGVNFDSLDVSETEEVYYELQLRVNDIDYPFIVIPFGQDGATANTVKATIDILSENSLSE